MKFKIVPGICIYCECNIDSKDRFKYDGFCSSECKEDFAQEVSNKE